MTPPVTTRSSASIVDLLCDKNSSAEEQFFLKAAIALSSARRETVFEDLVGSLAELVEADIAMIAVAIPAKPQSMQVLAMLVDGQWIRNREYDLTGSPCETVVGKAYRCYPRGVQQLFPMEELKVHNVSGYAGLPLTGTDGQSLGCMAVLTHAPLRSPERAEALLRLFSDRVVVEIERARTEAALKASEELYGAVFNAALDGIAMLTPGGMIVDVNPALVQLSGYRREELIGRSIYEFTPNFEHAKALRAKAFHERVVIDGKACSEGVTASKDGAPLSLEYRAVRVQFRGSLHILQIVRDISDRKRAEEERAALEEQLRHAQRMEIIGQLTGGIAHDFNNILTGLLGYVELAKDHAEHFGDDKLNRYFDRAHRSGARAKDLIQQMLKFSRGGRGSPRPVDLAQITRETMSLLESTLPASVAIVIKAPPSLPVTVHDPLQFEQVLVNLCINSRDAMNGVGQLTIELSERNCTDCFCCASCRQPVDGAFVELAITDTGPGIPPDVQRHMFEPFFSTKESNKGTGMGLAIVHGIVHEYGGHLVVKSEAGRGTTIRVLLPCDPDALTTPTPSPRTVHGPASQLQLRGRVLCVDDNREVGEFMRELLEGWGLTTTSFDDSLTAADHFRTHPEAYDFAILDQTMPQLTGTELATQLLQVRAQLPIVLYTGYSDQINEDSVRALGIRALVKKPLDIPHFRRLVESLLPGRGDTKEQQIASDS